MRVPFINGGCDENNIASYKVMTKIGMKQTAFEENGDPIFYILNEGMKEMEQDKKTIIIPDELAAVMETDREAKSFFESLTDGYKRGYCDWVGGAKQAATRQTRADKALIMLQKKQKTLKT